MRHRTAHSDPFRKSYGRNKSLSKKTKTSGIFRNFWWHQNGNAALFFGFVVSLKRFPATFASKLPLLRLKKTVGASSLRDHRSAPRGRARAGPGARGGALGGFCYVAWSDALEPGRKHHHGRGEKSSRGAVKSWTGAVKSRRRAAKSWTGAVKSWTVAVKSWTGAVKSWRAAVKS